MSTIDLNEISGLPLKLKNGKLVFGAGMKKVVPEGRIHVRMKAVLKNPTAKAPKEFYDMYRDIALEKDRKTILHNKLRFDITVLPGFKVGDEYNKTFGHYHPKAPGTNTWYPEVYEVLHGRALYLLTNHNEFLVYDARPGDKCLMLPGFAHVTVNPGKEPLVMANWVYPGFNSNYGPIEKLRGVQWYYTEQGFVKNKKWNQAPSIQLLSAKEFPEFGFLNEPMYKTAMKNPKKFDFLSTPQRYAKEFKKYLI